MNNIAQIMTDNVNGTTFVSMDTQTNVKLTGGKKNPLQGRVTKRQVGSVVMVFQNKNITSGYEQMIHRRLEKEGKDPQSFVLSERKWGTRLKGSPFVEHKGEYYLEVIFLHGGRVAYFVDDIETNPSVIEGLPQKKSEGEQGGLENKVVIRTFKVSSIKSLTINKQTFTDLYYE